MVDIVGAEAGAHQLLKQIGLFVRALGRYETGQRLGAPLVTDLPQARGGDVERLFPRRFAELREGIRRVYLVVGILLVARQSHQRLRQPVRMVDVVETEAPLDAEAVVDGGAIASRSVDRLLVLD